MEKCEIKEEPCEITESRALSNVKLELPLIEMREWQ